MCAWEFGHIAIGTTVSLISHFIVADMTQCVTIGFSGEIGLCKSLAIEEKTHTNTHTHSHIIWTSGRNSCCKHTTIPHHILDVSILIMFLEYKLRYDFSFGYGIRFVGHWNTSVHRNTMKWREQWIDTEIAFVRSFAKHNKTTTKISRTFLSNKGINTEQNNIFACLLSLVFSPFFGSVGVSFIYLTKIVSAVAFAIGLLSYV